jgi:hypothetical protein
MKYLLQIGNDTLAVNYKSKKSVRDAVKRSSKKPMTEYTKGRRNHLGYKFKGRRYCLAELEDIHVLTLNEYWIATKEAFRT